MHHAQASLGHLKMFRRYCDREKGCNLSRATIAWIPQSNLRSHFLHRDEKHLQRMASIKFIDVALQSLLHGCYFRIEPIACVTIEATRQFVFAPTES